jgi:hypothetical protein
MFSERETFLATPNETAHVQRPREKRKRNIRGGHEERIETRDDHETVKQRQRQSKINIQRHSAQWTRPTPRQPALQAPVVKSVLAEGGQRSPLRLLELR